MSARWLLQGLLIIPLLGSSLFSAAQDPTWNNLRQITIGVPVRVVLNTRKSVKGNFQAATDDALVVRSGGNDQTFSRSTVKLVTARSITGHRVRNAIIGAAIGVGAGLGTGAAVDGDCSKNSFVCTGNAGKEILTPAFAVIGAVIGVLVPSHSWHEIYRSN